MTDITPGSSAIPAAGSAIEDGYAGEALTINQSVYRSTSDNKWYKADADAAATATDVGIAINTAAIGNVVRVHRKGKLTMAGLTRGTAYFVSTTAGGICPAADLTSGDFPVYLGMAYSSTVLDVVIHELGVAI